MASAEPGNHAAVPEAGVLPLRLEGVSFEVDGLALLDGIDLELGPGPLSVVLGANGAGKSLLLRVCHGLLTPTRGQVHWCGAGAAQAADRCAMVFQRPVLLKRSAAANVDYPLRLRGVPKAARRDRIERALRATGLVALAERPARLLSGGEQQRLALAQAWALSPQVVFLDEPAAALDPPASRALERIVRELADTGTKIVMTTHDLEQARRMADEVLFLHRGRLLERAPNASFFDRPESAEARAFLEGEPAP